ncbi:MAG: ArsR/SmtB family transcription factor [Gemmobacter sp.]
MSTATPESRAFAALGHDARLRVFRLLVQAGPQGLNVSDIAAHLGLAPSTLAHHLSALVAAGLVAQGRQGREVLNRAMPGRAEALAAFLTHACCAGVAPREDAA